MGVAPANQTKERAKTKSSCISPMFVNSGVFPWKNKHDSHRTFVPECAREKFMNWPFFWFAGVTPGKQGKCSTTSIKVDSYSRLTSGKSSYFRLTIFCGPKICGCLFQGNTLYIRLHGRLPPQFLPFFGKVIHVYHFCGLQRFGVQKAKQINIKTQMNQEKRPDTAVPVTF